MQRKIFQGFCLGGTIAAKVTKRRNARKIFHKFDITDLDSDDVLKILKLIVSVTRRGIKITLCLSAPVRHPFWANLVQEIKIVSLRWNMVPRLIQICRIQWRCSFFSVLYWNHPYWENLVPKIKIISLRWNLVLRLIRLCRTQWCCSLFLFLTVNTFFGQISFKTSKMSV